MNISRRNFLRRAIITAGTAVVASTVIDPDQILWTPKKTLFLPPPGGWLPRGGSYSAHTLSPEMIKALTTSMEGLFNPPAYITKSFMETEIFRDPGPMAWLENPDTVFGMPVRTSAYLKPDEVLIVKGGNRGIIAHPEMALDLKRFADKLGLDAYMHRMLASVKA